MKKNYLIKLIIIALLFLGSSAFCQARIDVEAVARFYFHVSRDASVYVDGFAHIVNGNIAPYVSHRSAGVRDTALVARTTKGASAISWRSSPLPAVFAADSVNLVWVAGFGNNQGEEKFKLTVDEKFIFEFLTSNEPFWRINGSNGGRLAFTAIATSRWGAYLGYMVLTLPAIALEKNRTMTLQVSGGASENEVWYRTYAYHDVLQFIRANELKLVYDDVKFWNFGDITVKLVAESRWAGEHIDLLANGMLLSECVLIEKGDLAAGEILISREMQEQSGDSILVKLAGQQVAVLNIETLTEQRIKAFLEEELVFEKYIFQPGQFPDVNWKRPGMVENELGRFTLQTTFYDRHKTAVTTASAPGRYAAVVEGTTPAGFQVRRYITLFCTRAEPEQMYEVKARELIFPEIQQEVWASQRPEIEAKFSGYLQHQIIHQAAAAILLAGLSEMTPRSDGIDSPEIRDRQWWIDFKNEKQFVRQEDRVLNRPLRLKKSGKTLIESGGEASLFSSAERQRIREICAQWATETAEPLATLVAVKGAIVFHEAFGKKANAEAMTSATPTWMASITKLLTGVLLMQFVDQGLIQLDDPIAKYLPELAGNNAEKLTIRHLMAHTAGLGWHGEWASDWNPALENYLAHCLPYLKVGSIFEYNRAGYAIVGKIMERMSGRTVPYLFEECVLKPLGMKQTFVDNTYGSMYATGLDLARLGQMLLNRGVYGEYRFFSEESYRQMLPQRLPHVDKVWGIGTAPLGGNGLSDQAFGHEAASGAIFRIDPVYDLIIVSARDHVGQDYEQYERYVAQLIDACTAPLKSNIDHGLH